MKELITIQDRLKAPKSQYNKHMCFNYRSCEDILTAVKPLLKDTGCTLTISDEVVLVGDRIYVKATATLTNGGNETVQTTAYAREEEIKKGMDVAQITGSASSYARKYALNGMFAIDDTKDPDATNTQGGGGASTCNNATDLKSMKQKALDDASLIGSRDEYAAWWARYKPIQGDSDIRGKAAELGQKFPKK